MEVRASRRVAALAGHLVPSPSDASSPKKWLTMPCDGGASVGGRVRVFPRRARAPLGLRRRVVEVLADADHLNAPVAVVVSSARRLVCAAALAHPWSRAVGVEVLPELHELAVESHERLVQELTDEYEYKLQEEQLALQRIKERNIVNFIDWSPVNLQVCAELMSSH